MDMTKAFPAAVLAGFTVIASHVVAQGGPDSFKEILRVLHARNSFNDDVEIGAQRASRQLIAHIAGDPGAHSRLEPEFVGQRPV